MGWCYKKFALHSSGDLRYMTSFIKHACSSDPRKRRRRVRAGNWQSGKHMQLVQADSKAKDAVLLARQFSTKLVLRRTASTVLLMLCGRHFVLFLHFHPKTMVTLLWFGNAKIKCGFSKTFTIPYCACKTNQTKKHRPRTNQVDVLQKL